MRRAILHFGPPKTGTSALQAWCEANRATLARSNVRYASVDQTSDPKHQWLLKALRTGRFDRLREEVEGSGEATLILSCEGVMVHRHAIPQQHWAEFRRVMGAVDRHIFLVQRPAVEWVTSLWKQAILNPLRQGRLVVPSRDELLASPWFQEMEKLTGLAGALAQASGAASTTIAPYGSDWLQTFKMLAGIPDGPGFSALARVNDSPPEAFLSLYQLLAEGQADVTDLRLALFSVFCRIFPTSNLMLLNASRKFLSQPPEDQARQLALVIARLKGVSMTDPEAAGLAERLSLAALHWSAPAQGSSRNL